MIIFTNAVGADADEDRVELLLSEVKGKDITELIASGREKLASVPSGGSGGVAVAATGGSGAAPAAAELKKEEKVVEKEESDDVERKSLPHPERPDRLRAIAASLATAENSYLLGTLIFMFDGSWVVGHGSWVMGQVRPPGHHAGVRQAMGFCLHNNAAIAASAAQAAGAKKVLIVDWDVHHGNGTQEIFEQNKTVLYISLHRHEGGKFYPGTGVAHEVGSMGGEGYCVNVPWSRGGVGDHSHRIRQSSHDPRSKRLDPKRGTIAYRSLTETPSGTSCLRPHQFFKSIPET
ncbi:unnamed protein product [Lactuca saligna]|uniref:histone deacetylase n=1 Tax=Lactuca saligna TaxID=75948 RepID=A0AA36E428_LACSI|nr:unnamed protein product [Lactuca saligna]